MSTAIRILRVLPRFRDFRLTWRYADGLVEFYCLERIEVLQFDDVTLESIRVEDLRIQPSCKKHSEGGRELKPVGGERSYERTFNHASPRDGSKPFTGAHRKPPGGESIRRARFQLPHRAIDLRLSELNVYQPAAEPGNDRKLHPVVDQLFSFPPLKRRGLYAARGMRSPRVDCETGERQTNGGAKKNPYSRASSPELDSETARLIPLKEVSQALPPQQYFFAAAADC
jgi:hypothetical protein